MRFRLHNLLPQLNLGSLSFSQKSLQFLLFFFFEAKPILYNLVLNLPPSDN